MTWRGAEDMPSSELMVIQSTRVYASPGLNVLTLTHENVLETYFSERYGDFN